MMGNSTRTLRVYLFGHLDQWYEWSNWCENWKPICFVPLNYLYIMIRRRIQCHSGIRSIARISLFSFVSCFDQFCLYFSKLIVDGIPAQRQVKWDKPKSYTYVIKRTSDSGFFKVKVDESVEWPKFICLCIDFSDHLGEQTRHKKWNFSLRISSVNVTKSAGNCGFGHIYWINP